MIKLIDTDERKEDIISLWNECFGDRRSYIEYFLMNCPNICIGYLEDGHLRSVLFLLDGHIDRFRISYIYAACTDKKYRGRGLMSALVEYTIQYCNDNNYDGIFLVPGEESLYDYYSRFGFESCFFRNESKISCDISFPYLAETNDVRKTVTLRKRLLESIDSFAFGDEITEYSVREHLNSGGKIFIKESETLNCLLFLLISDGKFVIKELLCDDFVEMLKNIKQFTNNDTENVYIRNPIVYNSKDIEVKCTKCGMCYFLTDEIKHSSVGKLFYAGIYLD